MSMLDNLKMIDEKGIGDFLKNEELRWACPECNEVISVHRPACLSCGHEWR